MTAGPAPLAGSLTIHFFRYRWKAVMAMMPPGKMVVFDYSGTLSLEAPRFGRSENLVRALEESGLSGLGVSTTEVFWEKIVNPTWVKGSTTSIGYRQVISERIMALRLAPDAQKDKIEAATAHFVDAYLSASRIDPRWQPVLEHLSKQTSVLTVIATDHYAEATGKIIGYLNAWGIPAEKMERDEKSLYLAATTCFIANSADLGFWKADSRFWEILKSRLRLAAVRRILLIDDFGFNEESGDSYGERAKVRARQEKTIATLEETYQALVEVVSFCLSREVGGSNQVEAGLISETSARIEEFLGRT